VRRDLVMPFILIAVVYVSLLMSFTWETLTLTALALSGIAAVRRPGLVAEIRA
jgi:hypothetical protein